MSTTDPSAYTAADLQDPTIDGATLARVAADRPDLRDAVLEHPGCYPELATWVRQQQAASVPPPPSGTGGRPAAGATPAAGGAAATGGAPATGGATTGGATPAPGGQDELLHQMSSGARQFASGAKGFFDEVVAPAATRAVGGQGASGEGSGRGHTMPAWATIALYVSPVLAVLALLSLFLPALTTLFGISVNFFDGPDGVIMLLLFLLVVGCSGAAIVVRHKIMRIVAAVAGLLAGLVGFVDAFATAVNAAGESTVSVGFGTALLGLTSFGLLAVSALVLVGAFLAKGE